MPLSKPVADLLPQQFRGRGCSFMFMPRSPFSPNMNPGKVLGYLVSVIAKVLDAYDSRLKGVCLSKSQCEQMQLKTDNGVCIVQFRVGICRNYVQRAAMYRQSHEQLHGMFPVFYFDDATAAEYSEASCILHFGDRPGILNKPGTGGEHPPWHVGPYWLYVMVGNSLQIRL